MGTGVCAGPDVAVAVGVLAGRGVGVAWAGLVEGVSMTPVCAARFVGFSGEGACPGVSVGRGVPMGGAATTAVC